MANTYDINLFFYVKGSKDFPSGHGLNEPFGFDQATPTTDINNKKTGYVNINAETAVFESSIRDIYLKTKNAIEIENVYSLISDEGNCIYTHSQNSPNNGSTQRNERSMEYISSIIVKPSVAVNLDKQEIENRLYKQIFPNYVYTTMGELNSLLTANSDSDNDYPPRQAIFWQKMFTLIEFLKKKETAILDNDSQNNLASEFTEHKNEWYPENLSEITGVMGSENALGQYLGLFIGNSNGQNNPFRVTSNNFKIVTNIDGENVTYRTNPLRNINLIGTATPPANSGNNGIPQVSVIQEKLWDDLDIQYFEKSAYFERSEHDNRIKYISFKIKYKPFHDSLVADYDVWNFKIYFDADAFIADSTSNEFGVWTYNDEDLDDEYPESGMAGFNKYDNDYANLLRDHPKYGHFIASENEIKEKMAQAMLNLMKGNDYTDFVPVEVLRVSPEIIQTGETADHKPIMDVNWPSTDSTLNPGAHGVGRQTFYVLYNTVPPSTIQAREAIKDYILNLHSNCGPQVYYGAEETKSGVKYIGHSTTDTELRNWLSKMYPELFTETIVHIIPPYYKHCEDGESNSSNRWLPDKYFHTMTQKRIYTTMNAIGSFRDNFRFEERGNVIGPIAQGEQRKYYGTEIFYIGGLNDDQANGAFKFSAPLIATMADENHDNPLTFQTGFASYVPKFFDHNATPTSPADLLQFIIIKLMRQMFINGTSSKPKLNPIAGINITYSQDIETDGLVANDQTCNIATFNINSVTFNVHAQIGKNFCGINGSEVSA